MFGLQNTVVFSLAVAATAAALPTWNNAPAADSSPAAPSKWATTATTAGTAWPAPAPTDNSKSSGWTSTPAATSSWSGSATTDASASPTSAAPEGCGAPPAPAPSAPDAASSSWSSGSGSATANAPPPPAASDPSKTDPQSPSSTNQDPKVTHTVVAGLGGLHFDPDNVVAEIGEIVEFHFLQANHSVAQSSFDKPCQGLDGGFFPGFDFPIQQGQAPNVFQIEVKDKKPTWYYCPQTKGNHCQAGMAGVINQDFNSNDKTLAKYKEAAAKTGTSEIPAVNPNVGSVIENPQPNAGF